MLWLHLKNEVIVHASCRHGQIVIKRKQPASDLAVWTMPSKINVEKSCKHAAAAHTWQHSYYFSRVHVKAVVAYSTDRDSRESD